MFSPRLGEHVTKMFGPKIVELYGTLEGLYSELIRGKLIYNRWGDPMPESEIQYQIEAAVAAAKLEIVITTNSLDTVCKEQYEYSNVGSVKIQLLNNGGLVADLFSCVIKGTQYNCGLKEMVFIVTNNTRAGAMHGQKTNSINEQLLYIGFDVVYEILKNGSRIVFADSGRKSGWTYNTGHLLMSHEANGYVAKVAAEHPMWKEVLRGNNPNYGGSKHEYVMFSADIKAEVPKNG